jgi:hypothetical protein
VTKPAQQNQSDFSFSGEQPTKRNVRSIRSYTRNLQWFLVASAFLLTIFLPLQSAFGDNVYGAIRGLVTDPAGAVVANVTVTVLNTDTGITTKTTSSADGNYAFPQLAIGTYKLSASAAGFKGFETSSFVLSVN